MNTYSNTEIYQKKRKKKMKESFENAINEQNYLKYFIQVYTSTNIFYAVLNQHLAL